MVLVVIGMLVLALSALNGAQRLADLSRISVSNAPSSAGGGGGLANYPGWWHTPTPQNSRRRRRFQSQENKEDLPTYETAVSRNELRFYIKFIKGSSFGRTWTCPHMKKQQPCNQGLAHPTQSRQ